MRSKIHVDALRWLGGFAPQTFLKAFLILLVLNGIIDLVLFGNQVSVPMAYIFGTGLAACLFLAWLYTLWKIEPSILPLSILDLVPLLIGAGAYLVTGLFLFLLIVIAGYVVVAIWWIYFRAPALRKATQQWNVGNVKQAISLLDEYISTHPKASDAYQYRAWLRLDQKEYHQAEQDIQTALRLKPKSYFSHYLCGLILLGQGHKQEAKESLEAAVRLAPGRGISYLPLGIIYHLEVEHHLAVEAFFNGIGWKLSDATDYFVAYYYLGRNLDALDQSASAARAYKMMTRYREGYDTLVHTLQSDNHTQTPTRKLYLADLADMERRGK